MLHEVRGQALHRAVGAVRDIEDIEAALDGVAATPFAAEVDARVKAVVERISHGIFIRSDPKRRLLRSGEVEIPGIAATFEQHGDAVLVVAPWSGPGRRPDQISGARVERALLTLSDVVARMAVKVDDVRAGAEGCRGLERGACYANPYGGELGRPRQARGKQPQADRLAIRNCSGRGGERAAVDAVLATLHADRRVDDAGDDDRVRSD